VPKQFKFQSGLIEDETVNIRARKGRSGATQSQRETRAASKKIEPAVKQQTSRFIDADGTLLIAPGMRLPRGATLIGDDFPRVLPLPPNLKGSLTQREDPVTHQLIRKLIEKRGKHTSGGEHDFVTDTPLPFFVFHPELFPAPVSTFQPRGARRRSTVFGERGSPLGRVSSPGITPLFGGR
jgi:hypothetical protein